MATDAFVWTPAGPQPLNDLLAQLEQLRATRRVVTATGSFDPLHAGHVRFLADARAQGDLLVVGLIGDRAARQLPDGAWPAAPEDDRAALLAALRSVDHVVVFDDVVPNDLLAQLRPHVYCHAGDDPAGMPPEAEVVRRGGGEVHVLRLNTSYTAPRLAARERSGARETPATQAGDEHLRDWAVEYIQSSADALRRTAYGLRELLVPAGALIAQALATGRHVSVCGGRSSSALVAAAGLDYEVYQPPGRAGDVLLAIASQAVAPELPLLIEAARANGVTAIALIGTQPSPLADVADLCLRAPSDDPAQLRQIQMVVLRALDQLARLRLVT